MSNSTDPREVLWDQFLKRWPLEDLPNMRLDQYSAPGTEDNFCYWLEKRTEKLGSIWGGSSFKFGVYARLNKDEKASGRGRCYNDNYGWMEKYGATPESAFFTVRNEIIKVAQAARAGDLQTVEQADLGNAVRWKIAFLYQDRNNLSVMPIYKREMLRALVDDPTLTIIECHKQLMANRVNEPILQYGEKLWTQAKDTSLSHIQAFNIKASALNTILYGPPGTGKTYKTTELAVQIADPEWYTNTFAQYDDPTELREAIKEHYLQLVNQQRIMFTTFHQSFSYEDFLEGIRASSTDGQLSYDIQDGIFKTIAELANRSVTDNSELGLSSTPRVWKISIGRIYEKELRQQYISAGEARIGWNETGALSTDHDDRSQDQKEYWELLSSPNHSALKNFSENIEIGDILLCLKDSGSIQAVGIVTSDYFFDEETANKKDDSYAHCRKINWLLTDITFDIYPINKQYKLVQQTVYPLHRINWTDLVAELARQGFELPTSNLSSSNKKSKPNYVLIIDEINRGNISRIFGELITLLETDKRKGAADEHEVILPYSKESFSVPANLYVVGTMNTADKSLAQLDLALRRRFSFIEMLPEPSLLQGTSVYGVDIGAMLSIINLRIEALLDSEHTIGHAYFMPLLDEKDEDARQQILAELFRNKIIPLLREYFFDDYERISWILNDPEKPLANQFIQLQNSTDLPALKTLFSEDIASQIIDRRFRINNAAFTSAAAFKGILV